MIFSSFLEGRGILAISSKYFHTAVGCNAFNFVIIAKISWYVFLILKYKALILTDQQPPGFQNTLIFILSHDFILELDFINCFHRTYIMITFDLVLVFVVLLFILISLYWNIMGVSFTFLIGVITLGIFGVLTPAEIISGFGNEQVAVVILMLLFSDVIRKTDIIEFTFDRLFVHARTYRGFVGRMVAGRGRLLHVSE